MRYLLTILVFSAVSASAMAQQPTPPSIIPQLKLPEQLNDAFRDMMEDMKPALDETLKLMESFGTVGDLRHYHLPEVLPNGDIILRRKEDAPPIKPVEPDAAPDADGSIKT